MAAETITITCVRHRRRVARGKRLPITGAVLFHEGMDAADPKRLCDSQQFTVRREQAVSRNQADGELMVLELNREAAERAAAGRTDKSLGGTEEQGED